jgi:probable HAF family extracellular repeat protein
VTFPSSINNPGTTVGAFIDNHGVPHGWVRSADGDFTRLDDPAALGAGTVALGINDPGVIVGLYVDPLNPGVTHGFVYDRGTFTTLDYPGVPSTLLGALNDAGAIVGTYTDASGVNHGFLYEQGTFTPFDAPGAGSSFGQGTFPVGISSNGLIDGQMTNDSGGFGWVLRDGRFSSLNDPNAAPGQVSFPESISSNGRYVPGYYGDASGATHGYVATLKAGRPRASGQVSR